MSDCYRLLLRLNGALLAAGLPAEFRFGSSPPAGGVYTASLLVEVGSERTGCLVVAHGMAYSAAVACEIALDWYFCRVTDLDHVLPLGLRASSPEELDLKLRLAGF